MGLYLDDYYGDLPLDIVFFVFAIWLALMLFVLIYSVVAYVLQSLGMYTIAKRRGIRNPWLSWLPIGNTWILGSISDQYQYVAKGNIRSRRKVLLGLSIATYALSVVYYVHQMITMIGLAMFEQQPTYSWSDFLLQIGFVLAMGTLAIISIVFAYMAYYDLFESSNPKRSVVFLVLGIFFSFLLPFFVFACRKKDLGMPPRKTAVQPLQPVYQAPEWQMPMEQAAPEEPETADPEE
jgi:hypothetical protein